VFSTGYALGVKAAFDDEPELDEGCKWFMDLMASELLKARMKSRK